MTKSPNFRASRLRFVSCAAALDSVGSIKPISRCPQWKTSNHAYRRADFINCYNPRAMKLSPLQLYFVSAAVFQTAGSSGAAMLAPFFMKEHGYSVAVAGIPLVVNGIGRVCSDLFSGVMASYFSPGAADRRGMVIGLMISVIGCMFSSSRHAGFPWRVDRLSASPKRCSLCRSAKSASINPRPGSKAECQGQMAAALGIGFTLGPLLGGFVGKWLRRGCAFFFYARAAGHRSDFDSFSSARIAIARIAQRSAVNLWREGRSF